MVDFHAQPSSPAKRLLASIGFSAILAISSTGCGSIAPVSSSPASSPAVAITGQVHGGQQPVSGSIIQLFAVAAAGANISPQLLMSPVITDGGGFFSLTGLYTCPSAITNVYMVAIGGNPGFASGQTNPSLVMMSALGHCGDLHPNTFVSVNEITTVAAVYALAPYMQAYNNVGSGATDSAFALAAQLANSSNGATPGPGAAGLAVPVDTIRTLADILATCINSTGTAGGPCDLLFSYASQGSANVATDTAGALLKIALNPTHNVRPIFGLIATAAPFQPTLSTVPADWTLTVGGGATPLTGSPLWTNTPGLPPGVQGAGYAATLQAGGGTAPYTWSVQFGSLPAGLSLSSATGVLSGVPATSGAATFTVQVADAGSPAQTAVQALSLSTSPAAPSMSVSGALPLGTAGVGYASGLIVHGGVPAYSWSIPSGSLPAGLTLSANTGVISGTPAVSGTSTVTLAVTDNGSPAQTATATVFLAITPGTPAMAGPQTWYVRPDGGTRHSVNMPQGQCDGLGDSAYAGTGVNQHCAFKDVRYFWQDGSYTTGTVNGVAWGWIGAGGDTYLIRGSLGTSNTYRVGWNNPNQSYDAATGQFWGVQGNPYGSGAPVPLSGTPAQHTRILGENYGACHAQSARAQLHGGYETTTVLDLSGASNVDVACLDITDFSSCGKAGQDNVCNSSLGSLSDDASYGISFTNRSTNINVTDVRVHGLSNSGIGGPTGDNVTLSYIDILGNASSGWNADNGSGTSGTGRLLVQHFNITGNGCAEMYPVNPAYPYPYQDCTDQDYHGGYGDGFGTATVASNPGWVAHFDQGVASYNTQDGLDALHLTGPGSSMTITRVLAFGNMGQQLKVGGQNGVGIDNVAIGNPWAMSQPIPGFPAGFNRNLSLFGRAGNNAVLLSVGKGTRTTWQNNTLLAAGSAAVLLVCDSFGGACDSTSQVDFRNNVFTGFKDDASTQNPVGIGEYPSPIYECISPGDCGASQALNGDIFSNPGSFFSNNATTHARNNWSCPAPFETNAQCGDPGLVDESWHAYGFGDVSLGASSPLRGAGVAIPAVSVDFFGTPRAQTPDIGAIQFGGSLASFAAAQTGRPEDKRRP